jgi:hypothetical protein
MNAWDVIELVCLALATVTALVGWTTDRPARSLAAAVVVLLAAALGLAAFGRSDTDSGFFLDATVVLAGVLAVSGGGLVTTQVFALVDGQATGQPARTSMRQAGEVLRGGAWIGGLERLGVYAALVAGWAPGLAIVLAVKGLGRYPELRNQDDTGAAERFIIGTFTSVLWAVACTALVLLMP